MVEVNEQGGGSGAGDLGSLGKPHDPNDETKVGGPDDTATDLTLVGRKLETLLFDQLDVAPSRKIAAAYTRAIELENSDPGKFFVVAIIKQADGTSISLQIDRDQSVQDHKDRYELLHDAQIRAQDAADASLRASSHTARLAAKDGTGGKGPAGGAQVAK